MARYYNDYMSADERARLAGAAAQKYKEKGLDLQPVEVQGTAIAMTWWGREWNKNLESYADYRSRVGRGKSYVRAGAVIDLKIEKNIVRAKVQGTGSRPYKVKIRIDSLQEERYEKILEHCRNRVDNLEALAEGRFPEELAQFFTAKDGGLFPAPEEIYFDCSCPDWAYMCKHVAAVLYGIGNRLDKDPFLFLHFGISPLKTLFRSRLRVSWKAC